MFNQMLDSAEALLSDKKGLRLLVEENDQVNQMSLEKTSNKKENYSKKLSQNTEADLSKFLEEAKRVIDDQQMVAQQKKEIGMQQDKLMDKLAKRRGKKTAIKKLSKEEEAARKKELLDPRFE